MCRDDVVDRIIAASGKVGCVFACSYLWYLSRARGRNTEEASKKSPHPAKQDRNYPGVRRWGGNQNLYLKLSIKIHPFELVAFYN